MLFRVYICRRAEIIVWVTVFSCNIPVMIKIIVVLYRSEVEFLPLNGNLRKRGGMDYKRNIRAVLGNALNTYPAVTVIGARGTGKTRLVSEIAAQKGYAYCNLDEVRHIIAAQNDPTGFVARLPKPIVLDAVHRVPEILPALKQDVALHGAPGRYVCTTSSDPFYDQRLQELNHHMHSVRLYPLSQGELLHKKEHFIDAMFNPAALQTDEIAIEPFDVEKFLRGGFAQTVDMQPRERDMWFNRYVQNLVHHDVALQMQIDDHMLFVRLLHVLAHHAAQPVNIAEISRQSGIPITTLNRHLAVLKNAQVFAESEAWSGGGLIKKVTKAPQLYLHDVGLTGWLLGADSTESLEKMLRHAVYNELQKQMTWNDTGVKLMHMRMMNGREADIILERSDGKTVGIQVKNGSHITAHDTKGLLHCKERLGDRWHRGIILHTGTEAVPLGNKLWLLPISALWSYTQPAIA